MSGEQHAASICPDDSSKPQGNSCYSTIYEDEEYQYILHICLINTSLEKIKALRAVWVYHYTVYIKDHFQTSNIKKKNTTQAM